MGSDMHFNPPHQRTIASWNGNVLHVNRSVDGQPLDHREYVSPNDDLLDLLACLNIDVPPRPGRAHVILTIPNRANPVKMEVDVNFSYDEHRMLVSFAIPTPTLLPRNTKVSVSYECEV